MPLTREEAMKQKPPEYIIEKLKALEISFGIKHSKMREAFIDALINPEFNTITNFEERCNAAYNNITSQLSSPNRVMHFRDMYAYPIPIERELVLGYVIVEVKSDSGSSIDLRMVTSENNICNYSYGGGMQLHLLKLNICF